MTTPQSIAIQADPLGPEQRKWFNAASKLVNDDRLRELACSVTSIPSPTGEERALAEHLVREMAAAGLQSRYQPIDDRQGNALGCIAGEGSGPELLLYAPIDTLTEGVPERDVPWIGPELRPDMRPEAVIDGDLVLGLGASNPKGHLACILAAAEAIARAQVPLRGSLLVGFGAGGMPTNGWPVDGTFRNNIGQGRGCSFMLEQGAHADFAIIAKPGAAVSWEEVGLCWFEILAHGTFNYVGSRHRLPYRNAIVDAAGVIEALDAWFPEYAAANASGLVAPQGHVGAIQGGWTRTAAVSPAVCRFLVDLRVSPRTTPMDVKRQFAAAIEVIRSARPQLELTWEMVLAIPGTHTPPDTWVVQSCARAWEAVEGTAPEVLTSMSGATDANILRHRGIPTARVGMPRVTDDQGTEFDFAMGMNAVDVRHMRNLTKLLVYCAIDTCGRTREGVGISS